jgi:mitogen-activated protein kinase 7
MERLYPKASASVLSLLNQLPIIYPDERLTVEQALTHPFLAKYHNIDDEPICVPAFNFDFENEVGLNSLS